jgi:hypothetical protein
VTVFALLGQAATATEFEDARDVLRQRGTIGGDPPDVVVADLQPGQRMVAEDVLRVAQRAHARVILLSREPMVRPVVVVRPDLVVVEPGRRNLNFALALLLDSPSDLSVNELGRSWWTALVVGSRQVPLRLSADDRDGATVVFGSDDRAVAALAASTIRDTQTDARREARLREVIGPATMLVHLAPNTDHWLVMWTDQVPLWIASPSRIPARWCLSASLTAANVSFARVPAFAGDFLVAARVNDDAVLEVYEQLEAGPYDTYAALRRLIRAPDSWGFVLEAR